MSWSTIATKALSQSLTIFPQAYLKHQTSDILKPQRYCHAFWCSQDQGCKLFLKTCKDTIRPQIQDQVVMAAETQERAPYLDLLWSR